MQAALYWERKKAVFCKCHASCLWSLLNTGTEGTHKSYKSYFSTHTCREHASAVRLLEFKCWTPVEERSYSSWRRLWLTNLDTLASSVQRLTSSPPSGVPDLTCCWSIATRNAVSYMQWPLARANLLLKLHLAHLANKDQS